MVRNPIPEVFVLWHPRCPVGEALGRRIYAWLRPGNGLGPEVFYRSLPAWNTRDGGLPSPLPGEQRNAKPGSSGKPGVSNLQIVIPLVDENMVADAAWRHWLTDLGRPGASFQRMMMPVALDATAYNMPAPLRELNYLRPAGLPLPEAARLAGAPFEAVVHSLCKQLTEAMCRALLPRPNDAPPLAGDPGTDTVLPKVTIFLSHAKADGQVPARRLRDYIYGQTQLAAFYDENDIAFSSMFGPAIQNGLGSPDTAALVVIRSARYASRPWCRRELSMFRRPRLEATSPGGMERWRLYPALIVEAMEGATSSIGIAELGNSPVIRWTDDSPDLEGTIVNSVIRDAMLASYHSAVGASITPPLLPSTFSGGKPIVINWLPDPPTLLRIPSIQAMGIADVIHPGRGLSGLDLDTLSDYFPNVTFHSFEEVLS